MNVNKGHLSDKNHREMDAFLGRVLDAYKNDQITKESGISGLAQVMAALDMGNTGEAVSWFKDKGVERFRVPK